MATDTERREVARRLRGIDTERIDRRCGPVSSELATLGAVVEAVGSRVEGYTFSATRFRDRLADLIEPSCDRDALLALADEMDNPLRQAVWNQTPGVRREHVMREYARRIRESLGANDG